MTKSRRNGGAYAFGHAPRDGRRGWFVGHFLPAEEGLRSRSDVEVKWGIHPAGEQRPRGWSASRVATTVTVCVQGRFRVRLALAEGVREFRLDAPGDYLAFGPGVPHTWEAPEDCVMLTIRTPSVPDDEVPCDPPPEGS